LAIFRNRFPSRRDIVLVFAACVFPVHVWSTLNLLREVPAWVLRLSSWELIGVIAYAQAFAFLESVIILLVLVLLGAILPARLLRDGFVAQSSIMVFVASGWAIAVHYNSEAVRLWGLKEFFLWSVLCFATVAVFCVLAHRYKRLERLLGSFIERLTVLSYVYVLLDLLSLFVVIVRNV
jgi:hypothetical protein